MRPSAEVFAVEDTSAQLVWRGFPAGPVTASVRPADGGAERVVDGWCEGGPGSLLVDELTPDTSYEVALGPKGGDAIGLALRTLAPPPGAELLRLATISDLHLGEQRFGLFPAARERPTPEVGHPRRCADAAIVELTAWGTQRLVLKGDLTDHGRRHQWDELIEVLDGVSVPHHVMLGNHETMYLKRRIDPYEALAGIGHPADAVQAIDLPGVRLVLVDTALHGHGHGRVRDPDAALDAAAEAGGPALVMLHHHLQILPLPTFWPPGVSSRHGRPFLRSLRRANPAVWLTTGHSHRSRFRHRHGIAVSEVGSVKDYPGVWAGYVVHEGGIRQVVRRVGTHDCMVWTDHTRRVMLGAWRHFAPGALDDRCISLTWPPR